MKQKFLLFFSFIFLGNLLIPSGAQTDSFTSREMTGIIEAIRFSDSLEETNVLGEADVVDGLGKKITIEINLDTVIRDANWHIADIAYLTKGDKIKVRYQDSGGGVYRAQDIHVIKN